MTKPVSRRTVVAGAMLAVTAAAQSAQKYQSKEYWAQKGPVKLYIYRKRTTDAKAGQPVLVMVHGSSNSGRSS